MRIIITISLFLISTLGFSQTMKILSGSPSAMKHIKVFKLEIVYDDFKVKDNGTEEDLKEKIIEELDKESKDAGQDWHEDWEKNKKKKFPSKFTRAYNKILINHGQMIATRSYEGDIDGYIIVETEAIGLGYQRGRKVTNATLTAVVNFYNNADELLFSVRMIDCPGGQISNTIWTKDSNPWYATFERINESYAKCAKTIAIYIYEDLFKGKKKK